MTASEPVWTSTPDGHRDAAEIAALRPIPEPRPRDRKPAAKPREVTSGIVCFCGERFAEAQSLDFMRHLRAEVGEVLDWAERKLKQQRDYQRQRRRDPVIGELIRQYKQDPTIRERERQRKQDPAYRERAREWDRQRKQDPAYRERARERERQRSQDPAYRERRNERRRQQSARKKAERDAGGQATQ